MPEKTGEESENLRKRDKQKLSNVGSISSALATHVAPHIAQNWQSNAIDVKQKRPHEMETDDWVSHMGYSRMSAGKLGQKIDVAQIPKAGIATQMVKKGVKGATPPLSH